MPINSRTMTATATIDHYRQYLLENYACAPITIVRGEGVQVWDEEGRAYLDFTSGIAVNTLGHGDAAWVERMKEQLATLTHVSNLYRNPWQAELAAKLGRLLAPGKWFFCNSGAEANEAALKFLRLFGRRKSGGVEGQCVSTIVFENGFHGRTFGAMSATPQAKIQQGFAPLLSNFAVAKMGDMESVRKVVGDQTAGVLIEPVQGEGGIHVAPPDFLCDLRSLCDTHDLALVVDEVQCGIGRTGKYFAHEHAGIQPDAVTLAKGLGGGFPIGALWVAEAHAELFSPGSHGTTFGGSPLASTAALGVLEAIEERHLLANVSERHEDLVAGLQALQKDFPKLVTGWRGLGLLLALTVSIDPGEVVAACREQGLLVLRAGTDAVRLLPPLTVTAEEVEEALRLLRAALEQVSS